ncbi:MAG: DUF748 domain-containing protein [Desulfobulbaceae bacterium]|nr:DUF748 domain-containing protein [Desulfobulbaceae bacterium]
MSKKNDDPFGSIKISPEEDTSIVDANTGPNPPVPEEDTRDDDRYLELSSDPGRRKIPSPITGKIKVAALVFFICFLLYNVIGFLAIPYALRTVIPSWITESVHRPVTVGSAHFNPFTFQLRLQNTIIGPDLSNPEDQIDPLFSASVIEASLSPLSFIQKRVTCRRLSVDGLFLHIVRNDAGAYNIYEILKLQPTSTFPFVAFPFAFSLHNISITNSRLFLDDMPAKKKHRMEQVNIILPLLYHFPPNGHGFQQNYSAKGQLLNPKFSAIINGSPIDLTGKTQLEGDIFTANLQLQLNNIDLPDYLSYFPGKPPFFVDRGRGDILMELSFSTDADQKPSLKIETVSHFKDVRLRDQFNNISLLPSATLKGTLEPLASSYFFSEISLVEPEIHVSRLADGQWTLAGIIHNMPSDRQTGSEQTSAARSNHLSSENFIIENLSITNGKLSFIDKKTDGGFAENLSDVNLTLHKDSSPNAQAFPFSLTGATSQQNKIAINGELFFSPFKIMGRLSADSFSLQPFSNYFPFPDRVRLKQGEINRLESHFTFASSSDRDMPLLVFQDASVDLTNFILIQQNTNWLSLPQAHLDIKKFDPLKSTITDIALKADDPEILLQWDQNNHFNWQLFSQTSEDKKNQKWHVTFSSLDLQDTILHIQNNFLNTPITSSVKNVHIKATNISTEPDTKGEFSLQTQNLTGTDLSLTGSLGISPFSGFFSVNLKNYQIASAPSLITDWLDLAEISGRINAAGDISFPKLSYNGTFSLHNINAFREKGMKLFSCTQAEARGAHLSYQPFSFRAENLDLTNPSLDWIIEAEDSTKQKSPFFRNKSADQILPFNHAGQININTIHITGGKVALTDRRPIPVFTTQVSLAGTLDHLVNNDSEKMQFDVSFQGEKKMRGVAKGEARLFGSAHYIDLSAKIRNQSVVKFSPYLQSLLGHNIATGHFDFFTDYHQENDEINSQNTIHASGLIIDNQSQSTIQLPLTLALLSNPKGEITFNFPVSGTPSEPAYSFPAALGRALRNLALKTSVSPFSQLNSSFPEFEKIPDHLLFLPGEAALSTENKKYLTILSQILVQRPKLTVTLKGFASSGQDREAILEKKKEYAHKQEMLTLSSKLSELSRKYGKEEISPVPKQDEPLPSSPTSSLTVQKSELLKLAQKREKTVLDYLVTHLKINPSRVIPDTTGSLVPPDAPGRPGYRVDFKLGSLD